LPAIGGLFSFTSLGFFPLGLAAKSWPKINPNCVCGRFINFHWWIQGFKAIDQKEVWRNSQIWFSPNVLQFLHNKSMASVS
jgi:hypothetical protein